MSGKNFLKIILFFIIILNINFLCLAKKLKIVASTSLIESIIKEITKEKSEIVLIVPPNFCPGHFDLKPKQIKEIIQADIIFYHGWETWFLNLINKRNGKIFKKINFEENGMIPTIYFKAIEKITSFLCELDSESCDYFEENKNRYIEKIKEETEKIKKFKNIKAISSEKQANFLSWLGIKVVASYKEEISPFYFSKLIKIGKNEKVNIIVDNLQSGENFGRKIAEELKIEHITLTNFPFKSYLESLEENIKKIKDAIK